MVDYMIIWKNITQGYSAKHIRRSGSSKIRRD
jgi:hypothetical protein